MSGSVSRIENSLLSDAADDCTELYSCESCWTGSNNCVSSSTTAMTVPIVMSPRLTSQPPTPTTSPVAITPHASTSPKYQVETRTLCTCDRYSDRFDSTNRRVCSGSRA